MWLNIWQINQNQVKTLQELFFFPQKQISQLLNVGAKILAVVKFKKTYLLFYINLKYGEIRMRENTDQKKLRIWTLFTQCLWLCNHSIIQDTERFLHVILKTYFCCCRTRLLPLVPNLYFGYFYRAFKKSNNYVATMLIPVILMPFKLWSCWGIHKQFGIFYRVKAFLHSSSW